MLNSAIAVNANDQSERTENLEMPSLDLLFMAASEAPGFWRPPRTLRSVWSRYGGRESPLEADSPTSSSILGTWTSG